MKAPLDIRVLPGDWGAAAVDDIKRVLVSTGESLVEFFPEKTLPAIEVSRSLDVPIVHFQRGPDGEVRVRLNVEGTHWAQFAFQFGHELAHILCGYADYPNPNRWFEETLCETASLFVLGRMAETWLTGAPYPHWKDYGVAFRSYRDGRIAEEKLTEGTSLAGLFRRAEPSLRDDPRQRSLNLKMATAILPLFEKTPGHWAAVENLNSERGDASRPFARYLRDWSLSTPEKHREFIRQIAERFGVSFGL